MQRRSMPYPSFDFDEASELWKANKKRLSNGCYQYICIGKTKSGNPCKRKPIQFSDFCKCHRRPSSVSSVPPPIDSLN